MATDDELLQRLRAGDRDAFESLYDRHAPRLYALALRILSDETKAAAALEEVFLAVWSGSVQQDGGAAIASWLVRLTRDRCIYRQAQIRASAVDEKTAVTPRLLADEAFYRGMTVAELAAAYGLPETAVRAMLRERMVELRNRSAASEMR